MLVILPEERDPFGRGGPTGRERNISFIALSLAPNPSGPFGRGIHLEEVPLVEKGVSFTTLSLAPNPSDPFGREGSV